MFLVDTFCGYNYKNPNYDIVNRPNGTGDYLFLLFLHPMKISLNNKEFFTKANACVLFPPGTPHYYGNVEIFYNSFVHFTVDPVELAPFRIPENKLFYPNKWEEINGFLKAIQEQFYMKESFYLEEIDALVKQMFIRIYRNLHTPSKLSPVYEPYEKMKQVRLEILSNCTFNWTSVNMAELSLMSTSQFYHYYKLYFGTTPKSDILGARLTQAKVLLLNSALTIAQVAQQSGFEDLPHFSRYFKKHFGYSPRSYIKSTSFYNL